MLGSMDNENLRIEARLIAAEAVLTAVVVGLGDTQRRGIVSGLSSFLQRVEADTTGSPLNPYLAEAVTSHIDNLNRMPSS